MWKEISFSSGIWTDAGVRRHVLSAVLLCVVLASPVQTALARCEDQLDGDKIKKHVVYLQAERTGQTSAKNATGILVAETGLVLTTFELIENLGVKIATKELLDPKELNRKITIKLPHWKVGGQSAVAWIIGHDWRRGVLLLKIPLDGENSPAKKPVPLSRKLINSIKSVCFVFYRKTGATTKLMVSREPAEIEGTHQITWSASHETRDLSELGGAVLNAADGTLVGMSMRTSDDTKSTNFLPIEFADTLLSQVFIAKIMRELDEFRAISNHIKAGVVWSYQIYKNRTQDLQSQGLKSKLKIRFYFTQHLPDFPTVKLEEVGIKATVSGVIDNSKIVEFVNVSNINEAFLEPDHSKGFIEFNARNYVKAAKKQGYNSLHAIVVTLSPEFLVGEKSQRGSIKRFEINLNPDPS